MLSEHGTRPRLRPPPSHDPYRYLPSSRPPTAEDILETPPTDHHPDNGRRSPNEATPPNRQYPTKALVDPISLPGRAPRKTSQMPDETRPGDPRP
ncbi:hypothetical protein BJX99DRAFT_242719 [Aspergillus californicus]